MPIFPFRETCETDVFPIRAALLGVGRLGRELYSSSDDVPDLSHAASVIVLIEYFTFLVSECLSTLGDESADLSRGVPHFPIFPRPGSHFISTMRYLTSKILMFETRKGVTSSVLEPVQYPNLKVDTRGSCVLPSLLAGFFFHVLPLSIAAVLSCRGP